MNTYLDRIKKDRNVYLNGIKINDLHKNEFFCGAIKYVNEYYKLQDSDPIIHTVREDGKSYAISLLQPRSVEELINKRISYKSVADKSYGMLGRTPDFINSALAAIASHSEFFGSGEYCNYSENAQKFYKICKAKNLFVSHAAINPQVDRSKTLNSINSSISGVYIKSFNNKGIVVSGAKMIATLTPIADEILIFNMPGLSEGDIDFAVAFSIPTTDEKIKIHCRKPLIHNNETLFDHPIANLFDEMDSFLVLDDAEIPWDRVFIFKDVQKSNEFYDHTKARHHTGHQGIIRGLSKAELLTGVATEIADVLGVSNFLNVQERLGRMTTSIELLKGAILLTEQSSEIDEKGICNPNINTIQAIRYHFPQWYREMILTIQSLAAGSMLAVPGSGAFINNENHIGFIDRNHYKLPEIYKAGLLNLGWDLSGDSFGQRQMVYEMYHAGDPVRIAARHYQEYDKTDMKKIVNNLVESAIKEIR